METTTTVDEIARGIGIPAVEPARGWLEYLVHRRMKRAVAKAREKCEKGVFGGDIPDAQARRAIRRACIKAGISGVMSGAATTGSMVATAETEGIAGIVCLPLAAAAIGAEMATRTVFHVDLACELAELFDVRVGSDDVARLLSVAIAQRGEEGDDLGQSSIKGATVDREALLEQAAHSVVGESVLRNVLPFLGVVSSAVTNVMVTRRLGDRLRHAFRYEREMLAAMLQARDPCSSVMDLLVEGLWFVFTADGRLTVEETICLANRLEDLDEASRRSVMKRFVADESDWLRRIAEVPPQARGSFLSVLEVAAALDKALALPEEKLLRHAAETLGQSFDPRRVSNMCEQLERTGVLS